MNFNQAPLFKLVIPFIGGVLCYLFFTKFISIPYQLTLILGGIVLILHLIKNLNKYKFNWIYGTAIVLCFLLGGYSATEFATTTNDTNYYQNFLNDEKQSFFIKITDQPIEKEKSIKIVGEIIQTDAVKTCGKALFYLQKDEKSKVLNYGDVIKTKTTLKEIQAPKNEEEFDYKKYLSYHQIYHQNYVKSADWEFLNFNAGNFIFKAAYNFRKKLHAIFVENGLKGNELGVASALILGIRDHLEKDLLQAYSSTGATHVLAVSGLHVGIIYIILSKLLLFLQKSKKGKIIRAVITLSVLWFYALITGLSPSVLRAATMFSFIIIAKTTQRNTNIYNTLAASALLLLIINPYLIMEVGFQLSYLAVLGIVYIQPKLYSYWKFDSRFTDAIWQLCTVSVAAQLATFPLGLYYFHQFPNYFLFSNLVVIPLATVIVYSGIIIFITSIVPLISGLLATILNWIIGFMNSTIEMLSYLPFATTSAVHISLVETIVIYLMILAFLIYLKLKNVKFLFSTLILLCLLTGFNTYQKAQEFNKKQITIYNIANATAIDIFDGNRNYFYADSSLSDNKIQFHITNYRHKNNVTTTELKTSFKNEHLYRDGNFIQFFDKKIFVLNNPFDLHKLSAKKIKLDYLVYSSVSFISMANLDNYFEFEKLIISSSVPEKTAQRIKNDLQKISITAHFVTNEGMLQFK